MEGRNLEVILGSPPKLWLALHHGRRLNQSREGGVLQRNCCCRQEEGDEESYGCQRHTRTQYYIYKAISVIAEEMIQKKL
jgi:hypothetical protein